MKSGKAIMIAGLLALGLAFDTQFAQAQTAGSLDTTFGTGGTVITTFSDQTVVPIGAVQQSNGDIVVVSQFDFQSDAGTGVGVTRYTAAGKLDTSFGTEGSTFTTFPNIIFQALWFAIQPNGAIVVGGGTAPRNSTLPGANQGFGLLRFTANGVLDTTFGTNGLVDAQVGPRTANPGSFLLQPNGQIVLAGHEGGNGEKSTNPNDIPNMVALARYNANGSLDATFGNDGVVLLNIASVFQGIEQIALLTSGDYLIVSEFGAPATAQLSSTGVLQSSVTGGAIVNTTPTAFGESDSATLFQPNGDFIIIQATGNPIGHFRLWGSASVKRRSWFRPSVHAFHLWRRAAVSAERDRSSIQWADSCRRFRQRRLADLRWSSTAQCQRCAGYHLWQRGHPDDGQCG